MIARVGISNTLAHFLSTHIPLLFPPGSIAPLRPNPFPVTVSESPYALIQGVISPPEAEMAWLGACMAGADGWLNICVGVARG